MVSKRKQDSSSQTMPEEDRSDPPEESEEAREFQLDTAEGEGGRLLALQRGRGLGQWEQGQCKGGRCGRQGFLEGRARAHLELTRILPDLSLLARLCFRPGAMPLPRGHH